MLSVYPGNNTFELLDSMFFLTFFDKKDFIYSKYWQAWTRRLLFACLLMVYNLFHSSSSF